MTKDGEIVVEKQRVGTLTSDGVVAVDGTSAAKLTSDGRLLVTMLKIDEVGRIHRPMQSTYEIIDLSWSEEGELQNALRNGQSLPTVSLSPNNPELYRTASLLFCMYYLTAREVRTEEDKVEADPK